MLPKNYIGKMAVCRLALLQVLNFNDRVWRANVCYNKNFSKIHHTAAEILQFSRCWSWIFKFWKFQQMMRCETLRCISMPNFSIIGQVFAVISRVFNFSRWRPAAILDFQIPLILMADKLQRSQLHHRATFYRLTNILACWYWIIHVIHNHNVWFLSQCFDTIRWVSEMVVAVLVIVL